MPTTKETITLYFREGSSDKFYTISVVQDGDGTHSVPFVYGRRGTTGTTGAKCSGVDYAKAMKQYQSVVNEKQAKGYTAGAGMKPYAGTPKEKEATGIHCQLLNFVDDGEARSLIDDPAFYAQEKMDGIRLLLRYTEASEKFVAINRKGLERGFPTEVESEAKKIAEMSKGNFLLDGECVGTTYYVFDVLEFDGKDMRGEYVSTRLKWLDFYLKAICAKFKSIVVVETARTPTEKKALFDIVKRANGEGLVFKNCSATYKAGRPNDGGSWLKHKFTASASCIVTGVNSKRSISLGLLDGTNIMDVGNCTIPPNANVPMVDSIVEIRYLNCVPGGALYQPVYLGVRDDLSTDDCKPSQLKFKPECVVEVDE